MDLPTEVTPKSEVQPGRVRGPKAAPAATDTALLHDISRKLDKVVALLACQGKTVEKQIDFLSSAGFDSPFIGMVTGLEPTSVRTRLFRQRAKAASATVQNDIAEPRAAV